MVLFLSFLCAIASGFITVEYLAALGLLPPLPAFSATAAALIGVLIAAMEYRERKSRKKRRAPTAMLIINAITGAVAAMVWLYLLLT